MDREERRLFLIKELRELRLEEEEIIRRIRKLEKELDELDSRETDYFRSDVFV